MGSALFQVDSAVNQTAGFATNFTTYVNITDIPGYCEQPQNENVCAFCNSPGAEPSQQCTFGIETNACDPSSPLYNYPSCAVAAPNPENIPRMTQKIIPTSI